MPTEEFDFEQQDEEARRELEAIRDELTRLMDAQWGRRLAWRLLSRTGVFRSSFVPGDPHGTSFNEGHRNAGLMLMDDLTKFCPEQFSRMFAENQ